MQLAGGEEIKIGSITLTVSVEEPRGAATVIGHGRPVSSCGETPPKPAAERAVPRCSAGDSSRIERLKPSNSLRWTQIMAAALGVLAVVGITAGVLFTAACSAATTSDRRRRGGSATPSTLLMRGVQDGQTYGAGTGWVYDTEQGLVVTNAHVVYPEFKVALGSEQAERDAEIVAVAPCDDLALLQVEDTTGLATMPAGSRRSSRRARRSSRSATRSPPAGAELGGARRDRSRVHRLGAGERKLEPPLT